MHDLDGLGLTEHRRVEEAGERSDLSGEHRLVDSEDVVTSYNDCSVGEWDATYRKIWECGIGARIESIMVGWCGSWDTRR
jgi:hypothetical protein